MSNEKNCTSQNNITKSSHRRSVMTTHISNTNTMTNINCMDGSDFSNIIVPQEHCFVSCEMNSNDNDRSSKDNNRLSNNDKECETNDMFHSLGVESTQPLIAVSFVEFHNSILSKSSSLTQTTAAWDINEKDNDDGNDHSDDKDYDESFPDSSFYFNDSVSNSRSNSNSNTTTPRASTAKSLCNYVLDKNAIPMRNEFTMAEVGATTGSLSTRKHVEKKKKSKEKRSQIETGDNSILLQEQKQLHFIQGDTAGHTIKVPLDMTKVATLTNDSNDDVTIGNNKMKKRSILNKGNPKKPSTGTVSTQTTTKTAGTNSTSSTTSHNSLGVGGADCCSSPSTSSCNRYSGSTPTTTMARPKKKIQKKTPNNKDDDRVKETKTKKTTTTMPKKEQEKQEEQKMKKNLMIPRCKYVTYCDDCNCNHEAERLLQRNIVPNASKVGIVDTWEKDATSTLVPRQNICPLCTLTNTDDAVPRKSSPLWQKQPKKQKKTAINSSRVATGTSPSSIKAETMIRLDPIVTKTENEERIELRTVTQSEVPKLDSSRQRYSSRSARHLSSSETESNPRKTVHIDGKSTMQILYQHNLQQEIIGSSNTNEIDVVAIPICLGEKANGVTTSPRRLRRASLSTSRRLLKEMTGSSTRSIVSKDHVVVRKKLKENEPLITTEVTTTRVLSSPRSHPRSSRRLSASRMDSSPNMIAENHTVLSTLPLRQQEEQQQPQQHRESSNTDYTDPAYSAKTVTKSTQRLPKETTGSCKRSIKSTKKEINVATETKGVQVGSTIPGHQIPRNSLSPRCQSRSIRRLSVDGMRSSPYKNINVHSDLGTLQLLQELEYAQEQQQRLESSNKDSCHLSETYPVEEAKIARNSARRLLMEATGGSAHSITPTKTKSYFVKEIDGVQAVYTISGSEIPRNSLSPRRLARSSRRLSVVSGTGTDPLNLPKTKCGDERITEVVQHVDLSMEQKHCTRSSDAVCEHQMVTSAMAEADAATRTLTSPGSLRRSSASSGLVLKDLVGTSTRSLRSKKGKPYVAAEREEGKATNAGIEYSQMRHSRSSRCLSLLRPGVRALEVDRLSNEAELKQMWQLDLDLEQHCCNSRNLYLVDHHMTKSGKDISSSSKVAALGEVNPVSILTRQHQSVQNLSNNKTMEEGVAKGGKIMIVCDDTISSPSSMDKKDLVIQELELNTKDHNISVRGYHHRHSKADETEMEEETTLTTMIETVEMDGSPRQYNCVELEKENTAMIDNSKRLNICCASSRNVTSKTPILQNRKTPLSLTIDRKCSSIRLPNSNDNYPILENYLKCGRGHEGRTTSRMLQLEPTTNVGTLSNRHDLSRFLPPIPFNCERDGIASSPRRHCSSNRNVGTTSTRELASPPSIFLTQPRSSPAPNGTAVNRGARHSIVPNMNCGPSPFRKFQPQTCKTPTKSLNRTKSSRLLQSTSATEEYVNSSSGNAHRLSHAATTHSPLNVTSQPADFKLPPTLPLSPRRSSRVLRNSNVGDNDHDGNNCNKLNYLTPRKHRSCRHFIDSSDTQDVFHSTSVSTKKCTSKSVPRGDGIESSLYGLDLAGRQLQKTNNTTCHARQLRIIDDSKNEDRSHQIETRKTIQKVPLTNVVRYPIARSTTTYQDPSDSRMSHNVDVERVVQEGCTEWDQINKRKHLKMDIRASPTLTNRTMGTSTTSQNHSLYPTKMENLEDTTVHIDNFLNEWDDDIDLFFQSNDKRLFSTSESPRKVEETHYFMD